MELTLAKPGFGLTPGPKGAAPATTVTGVAQVGDRASAHGLRLAPVGAERATAESPQSEAAAARAAELEIVARCQAGDREALGLLLDNYRDRLVNLAFQLLRQRDAAEDVAQEAFTKAFSAIGSFRGDALMYTWLYRITVNLCLQRQRRAKPVEPLEDEHGQERADSDAHIEDKVVTRMMVEQTLDRISEPLRVVLILREMHDLSYEEVAKVLHIPVGPVRSRLNEARRRFRELWLEAETDPAKGARAATVTAGRESRS
jgi:RNA polymerase sigma-70 factor (ECF subfamily)